LPLGPDALVIQGRMPYWEAWW